MIVIVAVQRGGVAEIGWVESKRGKEGGVSEWVEGTRRSKKKGGVGSQ